MPHFLQCTLILLICLIYAQIVFIMGSFGFTPRGVFEVCMTGGSNVFFWVENLHAQYFFGSSDLSHIFWGLISERTFNFGFSLPSVDQKNIHSNFLSATCVPEKPLI